MATAKMEKKRSTKPSRKQIKISSVEDLLRELDPNEVKSLENRVKKVLSQTAFQVKPDQERKGIFTAGPIRIPMVNVTGKSPEEALRCAINATRLVLLQLAMYGKRIEDIITKPNRSEQIMVRVTVEEKNELEFFADRFGIKVADYIRRKVLQSSDFLSPTNLVIS